MSQTTLNAVHTRTTCAEDARHGRRLEYFTIGWNCTEAVVGILAGVAAGSIALIGFAIDSLIETFSGLTLDEAWSGWESRWLAGLSPAERQKYDGLTTQEQRNAFRITRNCSQRAIAGEFKIRCQSLGDRIRMSLKGDQGLRHLYQILIA